IQQSQPIQQPQQQSQPIQQPANPLPPSFEPKPITAEISLVADPTTGEVR
ncbi:CrcB family protein, partial [Bifidobacterium longum]|nr:CrcB family protein [Bifidobacterium longum]